MAKKIVDENMVLNIIINGDQGKAELGQLERAIKDLNAENDTLTNSIGKVQKKMSDLEKAGKSDTQAYRDLKVELNQFENQLKSNNSAISTAEARMNTIRSGLDLTKMSITDLRKEISRLTKLRNTADPGSESWKQYDKQLHHVQQRLIQVTNQGKNTQGALCRMADGISKYWNMVLSGLAAFTTVFFGIKKAINMFVDFEDVLADVQKTTGLTDTQVRELNKSLEELDTRSSQEEIMGLARIAGKLGIEGVENIEGFVRAADQINVALKEDLGGDTEDSIRQVGKLVEIFNVSDEFGIEKSMLKVGSVINELGASSTANEGYIVNFSNRVAGVAPSIGQSVSEVMGLASTLDQLGQTAEVSSTVYSKLVTGMFKNTAEYAKVAKMSTKEFSDLIATDANEALIRLFEGLKGDNDQMAELVANMGDIGMSNQRAVSVLGALSNNTEMLRKEQELANKAFTEGISLTNEYEIKNNNRAAQRAKAIKERDRVIRQLGEKLYPLMTHGLGLMNTGMKVLKVLVGFLADYGGWLVKIAVLVGVYTAALKLNVWWTTAAKKGTISLAESFKKLTAAMATNPFAAIATAVVALGYGIYKLVTNLSDAEKAIRRVKKAGEEMDRQVQSEEIILKRMFSRLEGAKEGTEEWYKARKVIMDKYGDYLTAQGNEITNLEEVKKAYDLLTISIRENARQRARSKAEQDAAEVLASKEVDQLTKARKRLENVFSGEPHEVQRYMDAIRDAVDLSQVSGFKELDIKTRILLTDTAKRIRIARQNFQKEIVAIDNTFGVKSTPVDPKGGGTDSSGDDDEGSPGGEGVTILPLKRNFEKETVELKERYAQGALAKEAYEQRLGQIELDHLRYRLANDAKSEADKLELREKIAEKLASMNEKRSKAAANHQKEDLSREKSYIQAVLESADSAVFKENKSYNDRLRQAGIFGKDREQLTADQLEALEILERQHQENLRKIEEDGNKKRGDDYYKKTDTQLKNLEKAQAIEMNQLRMQQNQELLDNFDESQKQRKERLKLHQQAERDLTERHVTELMYLTSDILTDLFVDELNLGEMILSEEQKLELEKRIVDAQGKIIELGNQKKTLQKEENLEFDVLGMSSTDWKNFFDNLKNAELGIKDMEFATSALSNAWTSFNKLRTAQSQKELKQYEQKTKKERAALDSQLEAGKISQEKYNAKVSQLDADLDAKKEELENEQREREKKQAIFSAIVSTAVGVMKAWELGPIAGPILAALVGAAGMVQIAAISAAQYEEGKYPVIGEDDGHLYQADYAGDNLRTGVYSKPTLGLFSEKSPEMVVDGATTRKLLFDYPNIYRSIMDVAHGRTPQFDDGRYPTESSYTSYTEPPSFFPIDPEFKKLLIKNIQALEKLMGMKIYVSMYGKNGLVNEFRKAEKYENQITVKK